MTEGEGNAAPVAAPRTAGAMLREARQAQGLHIAALSALIKVAQRKLEALEADRLDELPDITFTRALAQTVCRALKIDPAPVLALLPPAAGHRLEQVAEGINAPFRDRPGRLEPTDLSILTSAAVWGPALLILAAIAIYLLPDQWVAELKELRPSAPAASSVMLAASSANVSELTVVPSAAASNAQAASEAARAASVAADSASSVIAVPPSGLLQLHVTAPSWVEVHDANQRVLLWRRLASGETVMLDGALPLNVKIGNASATEVVFRGIALDLAPNTRDNVARLELK